MSIQAQQQAIVEMRRIVDAVFIEDQGVSQRADLQQAMPVHRVPSQTRDLQAEHDSSPPQTDLGHQPLESFAIGSRGALLSQICIDHDDSVQRPTYRDSVFPQRVLPLRALGVLEYLT